MLKTPPGVSKRRVSSGPLDEAGAVFETLYKKYLSLDADNLQKQAENYLLKSFYNKSSVKNNFNSHSSDFSEPGKTYGTQSSNPECVASSSDNFLKKTSFDLNTDSKDNKFSNKDYRSGSKEYKEDSNDLNGNLKILKKDLSYLKQDFQDSHQNQDQFQSNNLESNLNKNFESVNKQDTLKERVRFEDPLSSTSPTSRKNKEGKNKHKESKKGFKKPLKQSNKEDTRIYVDSSSDISEDSVENDDKKQERNLLTVEEYCDTNYDQVDEFLSPTNLKSSKVDSRNSLVAKSKYLNFVCTICILFQILVTLFLFGLFFLFHSFVQETNCWFVNVLFPFLVHFGVFYLVFTLTDYTIKKRFLVYTNDFTVDVLSKRLNRELCYSRLNKCSTWGERFLVCLGLCIACVPVTFTSDFKSFGPKEHLYLALVVGYLLFHLGFTYYYFIIKFRKLLTHTSDDD